jgi:ABC-type polysaccharide/polyol phosphate transport system ATPase subunit
MARVVLEKVRVDFPIYGSYQRSLRIAIFDRATGGLIQREGKHKTRVVVRALTDVSMTIEEGDRVGLIGHNGCGKSTLLKVIAGIYEPITGRLMVEGRVTPLFDVMPGLDLEDTGYENLLTSGMLLGLTREQIESKLPEIEEICELGEYLSLPVRTYSAGMTTRLGFALVMALEPGVLLMDEGFGTGDLRFAERAVQRMDDFIGRSRIIVLASHSDEMIRSMCNKAALLQEGRLLAFGPVDAICDQYKEMVCRPTTTKPNKVEPVPPAPPVYDEESIRGVGLEDRLTRTSGAARFTRAVARDVTGQTRWTYRPGETVKFRFDYEVLKPITGLVFFFRLYLIDETAAPPAEHTVTDIREMISADPVELGHVGVVELTLPNLRLMPNRFFLYVCLMQPDNRAGHDVIDRNVSLPALIICDEGADKNVFGAVSLDYRVEQQLIKPSLDATWAGQAEISLNIAE